MENITLRKFRNELHDGYTSVGVKNYLSTSFPTAILSTFYEASIPVTPDYSIIQSCTIHISVIKLLLLLSHTQPSDPKLERACNIGIEQLIYR